MKRVLLTNCNSSKGMHVYKSLKSHGVEVFAAGSDKYSPVRFSREISPFLLHEDPTKSEGKFNSSIIELIKKYNIDIVIPMDDDDTIALAKIKDDLSKFNVTVPISDYKTMNLLDDKYQLAHICKKTGIEYPYTVLVESLENLDSKAKDVGYPFAMKGRTQKSSVKYIPNRETLFREFKNFQASGHNSIILQDYTPGTIFTFSSVLNHGIPLGVFCSQKIDQTPPSGGVCEYGVSVYNSDVINLGLKILRSVKWYGVGSPEIVYSDGRYMLMEVNVRFFGYTKLALSSGVDLPWILYNLACGTPLEPNFRYLVNKRWIRLFKSWGVNFATTGRSQGFIDWIKNPAFFCYDYFDLSDPLPFFILPLRAIFKPEISLRKRRQAIHSNKVIPRRKER